MRYYFVFFIINIVFYVIYHFIGLELMSIIGFIIFDFVYLFSIYVWKYQHNLFDKIIYNCKKASDKPVILDNYNMHGLMNGNTLNGNIKNGNTLNGNTSGLMNGTINHGSINGNMKNVYNKRNVSETLKKYVAANQKWTCKRCSKMLDGSYEIDHIIPLYKGGNNNYENLMALCRNCHGIKTINDKLSFNPHTPPNNNVNRNKLGINSNGEIYKNIIINK